MAVASATPSTFIKSSHDETAVQTEVSQLVPEDHILELTTCSGSSSSQPVRRRNVKQGRESFPALLCAWVVDHQLGVSINLILLLGLAHVFFPRARVQTRKFVELSYCNATTGKYSQGKDDMYLVVFWIIAFTGIRVAVMEYILAPLARWGGVVKRKALTRFTEQAWLIVYSGVFWPLAMYMYYNSRYWLNTREIWTHFPVLEVGGLMKWYYLAQFAFWFQQILVVNIEERRKDYEQMFTHHIITCFLIFFSYGFYQTKAGHVILCCMDVVDLLLSTAKILRYLGLRTACDVAFGVFLFVWILTRHIFYLTICWSIHSQVPEVMPNGCWSAATGEKISDNGGSAVWKNIMQPFVNPGGDVCFNERIRLTFLGLLLALQCVTLLWLVMILKVAIKVITGTGADDSRSDDEEEEESDEILSPSLGRDKQTLTQQQGKAALAAPPDSENAMQKPIVREHFVPRRTTPPTSIKKTAQSRKNTPPYYSEAGNSRSSSTKSSSSSGISFGSHGRPIPRKELLGRIGCDKPS